jgi:hypothetical protein
MESTNSDVQNDTKPRDAMALVARRLLLFSSAIVNFTTENEPLILASFMSFTASLLVYKAASLEATEQQIAPGITTVANRIKVFASAVSIFISFILFWALLIEIAVKGQTAGIGAEPTLAGATGPIAFSG